MPSYHSSVFLFVHLEKRLFESRIHRKGQVVIYKFSRSNAEGGRLCWMRHVYIDGTFMMHQELDELVLSEEVGNNEDNFKKGAETGSETLIY